MEYISKESDLKWLKFSGIFLHRKNKKKKQHFFSECIDYLMTFARAQASLLGIREEGRLLFTEYLLCSQCCSNTSPLILFINHSVGQVQYILKVDHCKVWEACNWDLILGVWMIPKGWGGFQRQTYITLNFII